MDADCKKRKIDKPVSTGEQMWHWSVEGINTDCIITVGENEQDTKTFKLHKIILMKSSPVFQRMFETDMTERRTGEIKITDINFRIMELTLKHMYSFECFYDLNIEDIEDLCRVADKYEIVTLIEECAKYTIENLIKEEHFVSLLNSLRKFFSDSFHKEKFESKLLEVLSVNTAECLAKVDDLLKINENDLIWILNLEKTNLKSEMELIKFVDRWALARIGPDKYVPKEMKIRCLIEAKILPLIRFLTLSKEEYKSFCATYNWFNRHENKHILRSIGAPLAISVKYPPNLSTNRINRNPIKRRNY